MNKFASLPIFFDSKTLKVYQKGIQEMYGISDVKYKMRQNKYYLELTVLDEVICYNVLDNGICKLYKIRKNRRKDVVDYVLQE